MSSQNKVLQKSGESWNLSPFFLLFFYPLFYFPHRKLPNHSGNQITIKNGNYYVSLYHFKKESIVVELGQKLEVGDYLGQVGNSGYSTRPHLHIQVVYSEDDTYWLGKGIPIIFNNIYPIKNSLINVK